MKALRQHLESKGYNHKKGTFAATKRWLRSLEGQQNLDQSLRQGGEHDNWTVDHIIPGVVVTLERDVVTLDWPDNYFLMHPSANSHLGKRLEDAKGSYETYIGQTALEGAVNLNKWVGAHATGRAVDYAKYDPNICL
jgi:hypothetical protein